MKANNKFLNNKFLALIVSTVSLACICARPAVSFPQFQAFAEKNSGRSVNCSMCHISDDGPTGNGPGQIDSLTPDETARLNKARAAMSPDPKIDDPILNEFGNEIMRKLGMAKVAALSTDPAKLADALGNKSDLDGDGISDAQEYLDGTDPLNKMHGDPAKLFFINLDRCKFYIILTAVAVFLIDYGFMHLLKGLSIGRAKEPESK